MSDSLAARSARNAERMAADTLASGWPNMDLPIDPVTIAQALGAEVYTADLGSNVSGMLRKEPGRPPEIYANIDDAIVRRRFSYAHELGHLVLRETIRRREDEDEAIAYVDRRDERATTGRNPDERFANSFAANLLMPRNLVHEAFQDRPSPPALARTFGVSLEAMTNRLKNLRLI